MPDKFEMVECLRLPAHPDPGVVYRLTPINPSQEYYDKRTNRNIGLLSRAQQDMLRTRVVGIAGLGGMGGYIAAALLRLGIDEIRIADREAFDESNINRQFGAERSSVGLSKALHTASLIRGITDDTTVVVYPQGITQETAGPFADGCHLIFDEIEFYAIGARVMLHVHAREAGTLVLNCNAVGHGTFCFKFTRESMSVEEALGVSVERAVWLEDLVRLEPNSPRGLQAAAEIEARITRVFVPSLPEYSTIFTAYKTVVMFWKRLVQERRVSIVTPTPLMASGFAATRGLEELLIAHEPGTRAAQTLPSMPGYLWFDASVMQTRVEWNQWWTP